MVGIDVQKLMASEPMAPFLWASVEAWPLNFSEGLSLRNLPKSVQKIS